ncbi:phosphate ABC transporter permease PstA [Stieleria sp. TO1_6]|uniref:PstA family ABC transporter permease n=1 Tax=Stieleria tagensis TaxID=2956795 RepID=UPI00209AA720|nr:PstA family ABC transporter permease [Stieleria tagensis]MCO8120762.1 phosphate ABC transporter permease PstA [Stieleria tagensis]
MNKLPVALTRHDANKIARYTKRRKQFSAAFYALCVAIALLSVAILVVLLMSIGIEGQSRLSTDLLTRSHSELQPQRSGMWPAIVGSLLVCGTCGLLALPLGIGTAIFLEEFKPRNRWLLRLRSFVQLNVSNLAGVPSIVYGLLGLTMFVYMFNLFGQIQVNQSSGWELMGAKHLYQVLTLEPDHAVFIPQTNRNQNQITIDRPLDGLDQDWNPIAIDVWAPGTPQPKDPEVRRRTVAAGTTGGTVTDKAWYYFRLPLDRSFLAGGLTLGLVILPIIIIASQEALRSVPSSLREASLGLGATNWQTVRDVTFPAAVPGIMTGAILAMGRAIGEAAPILMVLGATISKESGPRHLMDNAVTMPVLIFNWAGRQQQEFKQLSAAAIIVLLVTLLILNSVAILIRHKIQQSQP